MPATHTITDIDIINGLIKNLNQGKIPSYAERMQYQNLITQAINAGDARTVFAAVKVTTDYLTLPREGLPVIHFTADEARLCFATIIPLIISSESEGTLAVNILEELVKSTNAIYAIILCVLFCTTDKDNTTRSYYLFNYEEQERFITQLVKVSANTKADIHLPSLILYRSCELNDTNNLLRIVLKALRSCDDNYYARMYKLILSISQFGFPIDQLYSQLWPDEVQEIIRLQTQAQQHTDQLNKDRRTLGERSHELASAFLRLKVDEASAGECLDLLKALSYLKALAKSIGYPTLQWSLKQANPKNNDTLKVLFTADIEYMQTAFMESLAEKYLAEISPIARRPKTLLLLTQKTKEEPQHVPLRHNTSMQC